MEKEGIEIDFDKGKEARVWQRVQKESQQEPSVKSAENLPALIMEYLQLAAAYRQLSQRLNGKDGTTLIRLAREANAQAVCLKGILSLMKGGTPNIVPTAQQYSTRMWSCAAVTARNCGCCEPVKTGVQIRNTDLFLTGWRQGAGSIAAL